MATLKKHLNISSIIQQAKTDIESSNTFNYGPKYIPDIITFCNSPEYLNLEQRGIFLRPFQRIILKVFYRGSKGNENLRLTEEEIELCKENGLDNDSNGNLLAKYATKDILRELVLVWGRRCVSGQSKIMLEDGSLNKIEELYDKNKNVNIYSLNENDYSITESKNSCISYSGIKKTYEVLLADGRKICCTNDHPLLTIDGWKKLEELKIKERVAVPQTLSFFGDSKEISEEKAALLGYMTGDGCCTVSSPFFTCSNEDIKKDFIRCLYRIDPLLELKKDIWSTAASKKYAYKITKKKGIFGQNKLTDLLRKNGLYGHKAHNKFVPQNIFMSPKNVIASYVRALFSCDGSLFLKKNRSRKNSRPSITYTTVSETLAYDVKHLLVRFGILSKLRKRKVKSNFKSNSMAYEIDIDASKDIKIFLDEISFTGKNEKIKEISENFSFDTGKNNIRDSIPNNVWKYVDIEKNKNNLLDRDLLGVGKYNDIRCHRQYSPNREKIRQIVNNVKSIYLNNVTNDNVVWMPIKEITYCGEEKTYDICVNEDKQHNFIANDIFIHNSGKDFLVSLVASYEAMRLLECEGGDPYAIYSLAPSMPISILTIATASKQADIAFQEIKDKVLNSKYFRDKIGPDGVESYKICLLTDKDKIDNQDRIERKLPLKKGSILVEVGHSNSDSLVGKGVFVLILDEVASYKRTGGSSSGERMYSAMSPSLNSFSRKIKSFDEYGFEKIKTIYDSKIISISSPQEAAGVFYGLFRDAPNVSDRLTCRLPTWIVDKDKTEESLREANRHMSEEEFLMEFGAEFSGTGGETFFPRQKVEECFSYGKKLVTIGKPGIIYFAHLDPATSSHNYALVIVHREQFYNQEIKKNDFNIVVDHIKHWHPLPDKPINSVMVDEYILSLRRKFYFGLVTYDVWNSKESIKKLRKVGIPSKSTHYTKKYKMIIYDELYDLIVSGKLKIPPYLLLRDELLNLQRKFTAPTGYSVFPKREGDVTTDDLVDALSGACYNAICYSSERLPLSSTVQISSTPSSNSRLWQSMSGPLGYGTGKQVADRLERINSWPNYKRLGINETTRNR